MVHYAFVYFHQKSRQIPVGSLPKMVLYSSLLINDSGYALSSKCIPQPRKIFQKNPSVTLQPVSIWKRIFQAPYLIKPSFYWGIVYQKGQVWSNSQNSEPKVMQWFQKLVACLESIGLDTIEGLVLNSAHCQEYQLTNMQNSRVPFAEKIPIKDHEISIFKDVPKYPIVIVMC